MAKRDPFAGPHGILLVDKPKGPTSHDIVSQARRHFSTRRVGHAGTLDPMATGVLVLMLGEGTKLSNHLTGASKRYSATVRFGIGTDSQDAEGKVEQTVRLPPDWLSQPQLLAALAQERIRTEQIPPTVSAIKVEGRRSYQLHRSGNAPSLPARAIHVNDVELAGWNQDEATFTLDVSKGYYVRAFARDLGASLGVPAHLSMLRRVSSGGFHIDASCSWPPSAETKPLALKDALTRLFPTGILSNEGVLRARQGKLLQAEHFQTIPAPAVDGAVVAWVDDQGNPVALGHQIGSDFRVTRGFIPLPAEPAN